MRNPRRRGKDNSLLQFRAIRIDLNKFSKKVETWSGEMDDGFINIKKKKKEKERIGKVMGSSLSLSLSLSREQRVGETRAKEKLHGAADNSRR